MRLRAPNRRLMNQVPWILPRKLLLTPHLQARQTLENRRPFPPHVFHQFQPLAYIFFAVDIPKKDRECSGIFDALTTALPSEREHRMCGVADEEGKPFVDGEYACAMPELPVGDAGCFPMYTS
jgi:hypothetical protein